MSGGIMHSTRSNWANLLKPDRRLNPANHTCRIPWTRCRWKDTNEDWDRDVSGYLCVIPLAKETRKGALHPLSELTAKLLPCMKCSKIAPGENTATTSSPSDFSRALSIWSSMPGPILPKLPIRSVLLLSLFQASFSSSFCPLIPL